jgi:membrane-associated phospholipid phosphatase
MSTVVFARRGILAAVLSVSLAGHGAAQADTIPHGRVFGWRDLAILEGFAILAVASAPLDRRWARTLQDSTVQASQFLQRVANVVRAIADPGAYVIGATMYAVGRGTKNEKAADLGLHGLEALVFGHGLGLLLKGVVGRARPYHDIDNPHNYRLFRGFGGGPYRSMPSSHTIAAFAAAAAVTSETSRWWPASVWYVAPAMYGGAALAGMSRMYQNRHWASDVITGAAIGTMAGIMVVRWHHMNPGNATDRFFLGASIRSTSAGRVVSLQAFPMF